MLLFCRRSLKNAGEDVLAVFFIGERDFGSVTVDLSGRNFAKTISKDSGEDDSQQFWLRPKAAISLFAAFHEPGRADLPVSRRRGSAALPGSWSQCALK